MLVEEGNLFEMDAPAFGQGVNVRGVMGAGIAAGFRNAYPDMYREYQVRCSTGELSPGGVFTWLDEESGCYIFNMASQDGPGPNARLEWLASSAARALNTADELGIPYIAIPQIGCGIGGLEWDDVAVSLEQVERNRNAFFKIVIYRP